MDLTSAEKQSQFLHLNLIDPLLRPLVPHANRIASDSWWMMVDHLLVMATTGAEPALRHIRLAWWRDELAQLGNDRMPADPLLQAVHTHVHGPVSDTLLATAVQSLMDALASNWAADDVMTLGKTIFSISDLLLRSGEGESGAVLTGCESPAGGSAWACARIGGLTAAGAESELWSTVTATALAQGSSRALRVLDRLAFTIVQRRGVRRRWAEQAVVLRVGLFGR